MDELCKVSMCQTGAMSFFDDDGNQSGTYQGYVIEMFVPLDRRSDVDRNDDLRKEMSEAVDAAITIVENS
jgi:hypothetical protein